jgi:8-oxo-dGTP pyrophosphatase MutT (NUDIX family)
MKRWCAAVVMAADEIVTIVDEANRVVGSAPRHEMLARRLIHRATYILVFNAQGEIFVQKRTATKDVFPSHYDVAAGGVVLAGEEYEPAARRELAEELGIAGVPLTRCFDFLYEDDRSRVWGRAYRCTWDGPMTLQAEEIERGAFQPVDRVLAGDVRPLTPDGEYVLRRVLGVGAGR